MSKSLTVLLRILILLFGMIIFAFLIWFPQVEGRNVNADFYQIYFQDPFLAYVYFMSIPFFTGLYNAFKFVGSFSVKALRNIRFSSISFAVLIFGAMSHIMMLAQEDDSPGIVLIAFIILLSSVGVAFTASKFEKRLRIK